MYWQNPNNVVMGGRLTYDPVLKEMKGAAGPTKVLEFSIGNNLKSSGSPANSKGHFFRCEAWGKTAEIIHEYCKKGDPITVIGSLHWNSWQDEATGSKRETVKIRVDNFYFGHNGGPRENTESPRAQATPLVPPMPGKPLLYDTPAAAGDDEIPF